MTMDKATALQSVSDVSAYVVTRPDHNTALAALATAHSFIESQSEEEPIMPLAPPVITTARRIIGGSGQLVNISGLKPPAEFRNQWASNSLTALKFNTPRTAPLLIEDILLDACKDIAMPSGGSPGIDNVTMRRIHCPAVRHRALYIRYDSKNWLVEDFYARMITQETEEGVMPMGIQLKETAHDLTFKRFHLEGFQKDMTIRAPDSYWNGDGFVTERGNYNIIGEDGVCLNNTDGGFDMKSKTSSLNRCRGEGNMRNFRFWTNMEHGQLTSIKPIKRGGKGGKCHIWIGGGATSITIDELFVQDDTPTPIFVLDGTVTCKVIVKKHNFRVPPETPLFKGKIDLQLL